jgi:DNA-directed RNA polymerase specialized sigma subunit
VEDLVVKVEDIKKTLEWMLEREPTEEELNEFKGTLEVDVGEWLRENAKWFIRLKLYEEQEQHDISDQDIETALNNL